MNYLEEYMKLSDNAIQARDIADRLRNKIDKSLAQLKIFLDEQAQQPALIERYKPVDFKRSKQKA